MLEARTSSLTPALNNKKKKTTKPQELKSANWNQNNYFKITELIKLKLGNEKKKKLELRRNIITNTTTKKNTHKTKQWLVDFFLNILIKLIIKD